MGQTFEAKKIQLLTIFPSNHPSIDPFWAFLEDLCTIFDPFLTVPPSPAAAAWSEEQDVQQTLRDQINRSLKQ